MQIGEYLQINLLYYNTVHCDQTPANSRSASLEIFRDVKSSPNNSSLRWGERSVSWSGSFTSNPRYPLGILSCCGLGGEEKNHGPLLGVELIFQPVTIQVKLSLCLTEHHAMKTISCLIKHYATKLYS
jgi:hypothetical protein